MLRIRLIWGFCCGNLGPCLYIPRCGSVFQALQAVSCIIAPSPLPGACRLKPKIQPQGCPHQQVLISRLGGQHGSQGCLRWSLSVLPAPLSSEPLVLSVLADLPTGGIFRVRKAFFAQHPPRVTGLADFQPPSFLSYWLVVIFLQLWLYELSYSCRSIGIL